MVLIITCPTKQRHSWVRHCLVWSVRQSQVLHFQATRLCTLCELVVVENFVYSAKITIWFVAVSQI